jgi:hypothetical protein
VAEPGSAGCRAGAGGFAGVGGGVGFDGGAAFCGGAGFGRGAILRLVLVVGAGWVVDELVF